MPAKTNARGYMVSRLPLGICSTTAEDDGITATSWAPRSMLRQRSSASGWSGGTSRSTHKSVVFFGGGALIPERTLVRYQVDEFQEMLGSCEDEMDFSHKERGTVASKLASLPPGQ